MLLEDYIANLQSLYMKHGNLPVTDRAGHEGRAVLPVKVRFGESDVLTFVDVDTYSAIMGRSADA